MIAGHFGFAALAKSREPQVPAWSVMLATVWLDIVFIPLYLAGIETIELIPGSHGTYGTGIIHADYTHSLLGALVISALYGLAFAPRWGRRNALVLGIVSVLALGAGPIGPPRRHAPAPRECGPSADTGAGAMESSAGRHCHGARAGGGGRGALRARSFARCRRGCQQEGGTLATINTWLQLGWARRSPYLVVDVLVLLADAGIAASANCTTVRPYCP